MKITFPSNAIRKVSALALALLTASASLTVFAEGELPLAQIYVSTEGDDSAAGTESAPLATLEAARDAVRALSREQYSGAQVIIRGGEYRRDTTFKLTAEDGGSDGFSVSYVAYEDETPVFTGAATLDPEKFTEPDEAFRSLRRRSRRIRYLPTISPQTDSIMPVTTAPVSTMPYFPTTAYMSAMFAALRHVTRISTVPTASATTSTQQRQAIMRARVITAFTTSRAEPHRGPKSRGRMLA